MKTLAAQALAYQYKLQIDTATTILNNNTAALSVLDTALNDMITATEKLKKLNDMAKENIKEVEETKEAS
jgi:hypothetical protein|tara:strand:- start:422 stop:631 length:210 start_codon:yes stop_codon:yes gene_type:complete